MRTKRKNYDYHSSDYGNEDYGQEDFEGDDDDFDEEDQVDESEADSDYGQSADEKGKKNQNGPKAKTSNKRGEKAEQEDDYDDSYEDEDPFSPEIDQILADKQLEVTQQQPTQQQVAQQAQGTRGNRANPMQITQTKVVKNVFLIKFVDQSYLHVRWMEETELEEYSYRAKQKIRRYWNQKEKKRLIEQIQNQAIKFKQQKNHHFSEDEEEEEDDEDAAIKGIPLPALPLEIEEAIAEGDQFKPQPIKVEGPDGEDLTQYFDKNYTFVERILSTTILFPVIHPRQAKQIRGKWQEDCLKVMSVLINFRKNDVCIGLPFAEQLDTEKQGLQALTPNSEDLADYFKVVKQPIDFKMIMNRLYNKSYQQPGDFWNDLGLVFRNCRSYYKSSKLGLRKQCEALRFIAYHLYNDWHNEQKTRFTTGVALPPPPPPQYNKLKQNVQQANPPQTISNGGSEGQVPASNGVTEISPAQATQNKQTQRDSTIVNLQSLLQNQKNAMQQQQKQQQQQQQQQLQQQTQFQQPQVPSKQQPMSSQQSSLTPKLPQMQDSQLTQPLGPGGLPFNQTNELWNMQRTQLQQQQQPQQQIPGIPNFNQPNQQFQGGIQQQQMPFQQLQVTPQQQQQPQQQMMGQPPNLPKLNQVINPMNQNQVPNFQDPLMQIQQQMNPQAFMNPQQQQQQQFRHSMPPQNQTGMMFGPNGTQIMPTQGGFPQQQFEMPQMQQPQTQAQLDWQNQQAQSMNGNQCNPQGMFSNPAGQLQQPSNDPNQPNLQLPGIGQLSQGILQNNLMMMQQPNQIGMGNPFFGGASGPQGMDMNQFQILQQEQNKNLNLLNQMIGIPQNQMGQMQIDPMNPMSMIAQQQPPQKHQTPDFGSQFGMRQGGQPTQLPSLSQISGFTQNSMGGIQLPSLSSLGPQFGSIDPYGNMIPNQGPFNRFNFPQTSSTNFNSTNAYDEMSMMLSGGAMPPPQSQTNPSSLSTLPGGFNPFGQSFGGGPADIHQGAGGPFGIGGTFGMPAPGMMQPPASHPQHSNMYGGGGGMPSQQMMGSQMHQQMGSATGGMSNIGMFGGHQPFQQHQHHQQQRSMQPPQQKTTIIDPNLIQPDINENLNDKQDPPVPPCIMDPGAYDLSWLLEPGEKLEDILKITYLTQDDIDAAIKNKHYVDQLYLVKWKGLSYNQSTWEPESLIRQYNEDRVQDFNRFNRSLDQFQRDRLDQLIKNHKKMLRFTERKYQNQGKRIDPAQENYQSLQEAKINRALLNQKIQEIMGDAFYQLVQYSNEKGIVPQFKKPSQRLKDYQVQGLNWLIRAWHEHRNVVLADEMGLGKTIMTLSLFDHLNKVYKLRGPYLILAPLTTLEHWKRIADEWTSLNSVLYYDPGSADGRQEIRTWEWFYTDVTYKGTITQKSELYKFNIMITSFEVFMQDLNPILQEIPFIYIVVDEAHRLKNKQAKTLKLLKDHPCKRILLLTGTPVQNNTKELWTLLNYIEPEKFNSLDSFLEQYGNLETYEQIQKLHTILKPHFLRRLKEEVDNSIPPLNETVIEVGLTTLQNTYYKGIYGENRMMLAKFGTNSIKTSQLNNIDVQLRKCCNHLFLLKGVEEEITRECKNEQDLFKKLLDSSGKLMLLDKFIEKFKQENHKMLIFSQFKRMLDVIELYLKMKGVDYEKLTGSVKTQDRISAIQRFNDDKSFGVFLLTTRAGGLGINLTSARVVIIFDSDWNPQNDLQAIARAHRIGQKFEVQVYRLITSKTYEEQMFERASKKLGMEQALFSKGAFHQNDVDVGSLHLRGISELKQDSKEIENLLKYGAYAFIDNDGEQDDQVNKDIDEILATGKKKEFTYSKGLYTLQKSTFNASKYEKLPNVEDPDFWNKVMPYESIISISVLEKKFKKEKKEMGNSEKKQKEFIKDLEVVFNDFMDAKFDVRTTNASRKQLESDEEKLRELLKKMIKLTGMKLLYVEKCKEWLREMLRTSKRKKPLKTFASEGGASGIANGEEGAAPNIQGTNEDEDENDPAIEEDDIIIYDSDAEQQNLLNSRSLRRRNVQNPSATQQKDQLPNHLKPTTGKRGRKPKNGKAGKGVKTQYEDEDEDYGDEDYADEEYKENFQDTKKSQNYQSDEGEHENEQSEEEPEARYGLRGRRKRQKTGREEMLHQQQQRSGQNLPKINDQFAKRNEKNGIVCSYCLHPETQNNLCAWFCYGYCQRFFHEECKDTLFSTAQTNPASNGQGKRVQTNTSNLTQQSSQFNKGIWQCDDCLENKAPCFCCKQKGQILVFPKKGKPKAAGGQNASEANFALNSGVTMNEEEDDNLDDDFNDEDDMMMELDNQEDAELPMIQKRPNLCIYSQRNFKFVPEKIYEIQNEEVKDQQQDIEPQVDESKQNDEEQKQMGNCKYENQDKQDEKKNVSQDSQKALGNDKKDNGDKVDEIQMEGVQNIGDQEQDSESNSNNEEGITTPKSKKDQDESSDIGQDKQDQEMKNPEGENTEPKKDESQQQSIPQLSQSVSTKIVIQTSVKQNLSEMADEKSPQTEPEVNDNKYVVRCTLGGCFKYYHVNCVYKNKNVSCINSMKVQRFRCPLHYCEICQASGDSVLIVQCVQCPTAYHLKCLPQDTKAIRLTKKYIICGKHNMSPEDFPKYEEKTSSNIYAQKSQSQQQLLQNQTINTQQQRQGQAIGSTSSNLNLSQDKNKKKKQKKRGRKPKNALALANNDDYGDEISESEMNLKQSSDTITLSGQHQLLGNTKGSKTQSQSFVIQLPKQTSTEPTNTTISNKISLHTGVGMMPSSPAIKETTYNNQTNTNSMVSIDQRQQSRSSQSESAATPKPLFTVEKHFQSRNSSKKTHHQKEY